MTVKKIFYYRKWFTQVRLTYKSSFGQPWKVDMAMQTVNFKEHEGIVQNSVGQMLSVTSAPWWSSFGSQSIYGDSCGQLKPFSLELPNYVDQLSATKQAGRGTERVLDKGHTTQFTIFPGKLLLLICWDL